MALINRPPDGETRPGWPDFFNQIFRLLSALILSGETASRPTVFLWIGRPYFDTDLGIPIWVQSLSPAVWVDATGAPA